MSIDRTEFWILDDVRRAVREKCIGSGSWQRDAVVCGYVAQLAQRCLRLSRRRVAWRRVGERGRASRIDTQLMHFVASGLEHLYLDNYLGLCVVHIVDDFSREGQFVRRIADDDSVLRIQLLDSLEVE